MDVGSAREARIVQFENAPDATFGEALGEIEQDGGLQGHTRIQVLTVGAVPREGLAAVFLVVPKDLLIASEEHLLRKGVTARVRPLAFSAAANDAAASA